MLDNKVILITGGTGTFGKKCTEIILKKYKPKKLIIFSRDELKQFEMTQIFPVRNILACATLLEMCAIKNGCHALFVGLIM